MKTDTPKPILLKSYKPSPWLIETVHLDVALDPTGTRVRSRLKLKPNPKAGASAKVQPLKLDGELLTLTSIAINGRPLEAKAYKTSAKGLSSCRSARRLDHSRSRSRTPAIPRQTRRSRAFISRAASTARSARRRASGASPTISTAPTFSPLSPHASRPTRRPRPCCSPMATSSRPASSIAASATTPSGRTRTRSRPICSPSSAASSAPSPRPSRPCRAARSISASTSNPARRTAAAGPWNA